jgi:hypothetical protein
MLQHPSPFAVLGLACPARVSQLDVQIFAEPLHATRPKRCWPTRLLRTHHATSPHRRLPAPAGGEDLAPRQRAAATLKYNGCMASNAVEEMNSTYHRQKACTSQYIQRPFRTPSMSVSVECVSSAAEGSETHELSQQDVTNGHKVGHIHVPGSDVESFGQIAVLFPRACTDGAYVASLRLPLP